MYYNYIMRQETLLDNNNNIEANKAVSDKGNKIICKHQNV